MSARRVMGRTAEDTGKGSLSPHPQRSTYQLVRDVSMVLSGHSFSNSRFHQPGKQGQHIDRWVNLSVVQLSVHIDLPLSNIPSQVRDGMSDICRRKTSGLSTWLSHMANLTRRESTLSTQLCCKSSRESISGMMLFVLSNTAVRWLALIVNKYNKGRESCWVGL